jgi:hypothetical protein
MTQDVYSGSWDKKKHWIPYLDPQARCKCYLTKFRNFLKYNVYEVRTAASRHQESAVLRAGEVGVPAGQAQRAELLPTRGTAHRHTLHNRGGVKGA